jgi:hypothetical protein
VPVLVLVLGGPLASWPPALRLAARASRFAVAQGERLAFLLTNRIPDTRTGTGIGNGIGARIGIGTAGARAMSIGRRRHERESESHHGCDRRGREPRASSATAGT